MKTITACAVVLCLAAATASAREVSISFNSDDSHTRMGARHEVREARTAITTRDGSTTLLLLKDTVAIQLSDNSLAHMKSEDHDNFLEEVLLSGVKFALRKSVEYPIANIRTAEVRGGVLVLTTDQNKPLFDDVKVNGADVLRSFSTADAVKFVNAFKAAKR
jgi:hypothetical protein